MSPKHLPMSRGNDTVGCLKDLMVVAHMHVEGRLRSALRHEQESKRILKSETRIYCKCEV